MADLGAIGIQINGSIETLFDEGDIDHNTTWAPHGEQIDALQYHIIANQWQIDDDDLITSLIDTSGTISGKVYYDGIPLDRQTVILHLSASHFDVSRARTDSGGNFVFYGLNKSSNYYYITVPGSSSGIVRVNLTADAFVEIGLYSVSSRRPLVLINGIITEAPDGTTWAVGVPAAAVSTYSANVGDGTNTSYTITHSLGTRDVVVETRDNNSPYGVVDVNWEATTTSAITITFESPPTTNRYRVNIIAL
jgi:hypothetical protein